MKISIKVKPNSGKQEIKKLSESEYIIYLKSAPENNKANLELIKLLRKYFKKQTRIISGLSSRKKIVELK